MIKNDDECNMSIQFSKDGEETLRHQKREMEKIGLSKEEIKTATDPLAGFPSQIREKIDA